MTAAPSRPAACPTCCPAAVRSPTPPPASTWPPPGASTRCPRPPVATATRIVAALTDGELGGLVVGGVDPDDTADPAATRAALDAASFVVTLELRETDVTRAADVVLPVAPVSDKAGTFVNWEGRPRPFEAVLANPHSLPDLRVLAGIAEELGAAARLPHGRGGARRDGGDGPLGRRPRHAPAVAPAEHAAPAADGETLALATWKQLLDNGSMQDGEKALRATARMAVARLPRSVYDAVGPVVTLTGERGSMTLPVEVADLPDGVVWVPANSAGAACSPTWASPGSPVTVRGADQ